MSPEWSVSFEYRRKEESSITPSVIQFTIGGKVYSFGDRVPAVHILPDGKFRISSAINTNSDHYFIPNIEIQLDRVYKIEIHQRYISNGNYRFFIKIDGDELHSIVNTMAKQFYNVKVFASVPSQWDATDVAYISNFQFTNFL